jgi:hydroxyacylglutathione hydrolase
VVGEGSLERVVEESMLVGFEDFAGWLDGGMEAWVGAGLPVSAIELVDLVTAENAVAEGAVPLNVLEPGELAEGLIPGAVHVPLGEITARAGELPREIPLVVYCGHGERASSAVSLLGALALGRWST